MARSIKKDKKNLTPLQLKKLVISALEDVKARDLVVLDVRKMTTLTDYMVICSGTSGRHIKSLAQNVVKKAKEQGINPYGVEGEQEADWILIDLLDVIVHVMTPITRDFYRLELLWSPKPKKVKKSK